VFKSWIGEVFNIHPRSQSTGGARANGPDVTGVCLLIESFPRVAGAERQLQTLIPALARRRISVAVVTRGGDPLRAREPGTTEPVYRMPARGGRTIASVSFSLSVLLFLARQRRRFHVLHAHDLFSPATTGILGKLVFRRPVVVKLLRGGRLGDVAVLRSTRFGPLRLWLLARLVDVFIAVSDEIQRELQAIGVPIDRIARIPNGVDADRFCPADDARRRALRRKLQIEGRLVGLFMGRLEPEKRLDCLLDAWPKVRQALPDALLVVAGDGWQRPALRARAVPGVRFVGVVDDPVPYLQAADCFVLPSETEGLPNALLEAMASGLPCVATAIGGNVDALCPGVEGWLVPPGDADALGVAVVEALSGEDRQRLAAAARTRVLGDFQIEATADRLAHLYRRLARSRSPALTTPGRSTPDALAGRMQYDAQPARSSLSSHDEART
jgi:glycosyltransferase involved in cell wall biosynthesis